MSRRLASLLTLAGACLLISAPWIFVALPGRLADFVHRETVYAGIIERETTHHTDPHQRLLALFRFVQLHVLVFPGQKIDRFTLSKAPLEYLLLQSGWCDQQNGILLALAQRAGLPGHLLILFDQDGVPGHVVSVIDAGGASTILDTYYGLYFLTPAGDLSPVESVVGAGEYAPGLYSPQYEGIKAYGPVELKTEVETVMNLILDPGDTRSQTLDYDGARRFISRVIFFFHEIFDKLFISTIQDLYFASHDIGKYQKARFMQLAGRYTEAARAYNELLASNAGGASLPRIVYSGSRVDAPGLEEAVLRYSLAQTLWSSGLLNDARRQFELLQTSSEDSGWSDAADYFLGDIDFKEGNPEYALVRWANLFHHHSFPMFEVITNNSDSHPPDALPSE